MTLAAYLRSTSLLASALAGVLLCGQGGQARAQDEQMRLVSTIDVGGNGLGSFDISYVDPTIDLYVLADRTNASVDFFDASDATFTGRVTGFRGAQATTSISGPNGVVVVDHKEVWAGDGDSTVKVIDIATFQITDSISTNGKFRADEVSYDPVDHILAAANNADTPPFLTFIDTNTHAVLKQIVFDGTNGTPNALGGLEQSQYSPKTGLFYISVPQIGSDTTLGGLTAIDPHTFQVVSTFPVSYCTPAGLALGPKKQALLGCSASFGTAPNVLTQSVVISLVNGNILANITQVGGSDEVWFDPGSGHYYLGARNNEDSSGTIVPVLGTIDAVSNVADANTPTSVSAHSVAADRISLHVFVPIGFPAPGVSDPTNPCPVVSRGCIAVYLPSSIDDDDTATRQSRLQAKR
ncbi:MAG: hypothetical protein JO122_11380 [Acetobacteraceae bacterium]|nr:hypothetical protein [Acetobacteraceae bacterium]